MTLGISGHQQSSLPQREFWLAVYPVAIKRSQCLWLLALIQRPVDGKGAVIRARECCSMKAASEGASDPKCSMGSAQVPTSPRPFPMAPQGGVWHRATPPEQFTDQRRHTTSRKRIAASIFDSCIIPGGSANMALWSAVNAGASLHSDCYAGSLSLSLSLAHTQSGDTTTTGACCLLSIPHTPAIMHTAGHSVRAPGSSACPDNNCGRTRPTYLTVGGGSDSVKSKSVRGLTGSTADSCAVGRDYNRMSPPHKGLADEGCDAIDANSHIHHYHDRHHHHHHHHTIIKEKCCGTYVCCLCI
ncbi:hypothetical protein K431DRAFT_345023 [Polychaeton citri CBS 116435]|uniref:Uncharacterized protein n=1 Tax=Polychaeton citri CBS 116435 TaxID=1314669 RepID=A0A9P4QEC8_9PEZI|nr:hypothetical protein K431DRAFT_345023 [Polychaeton citri CBS 116435]